MACAFLESSDATTLGTATTEVMSIIVPIIRSGRDQPHQPRPQPKVCDLCCRVTNFTINWSNVQIVLVQNLLYRFGWWCWLSWLHVRPLPPVLSTSMTVLSAQLSTQLVELCRLNNECWIQLSRQKILLLFDLFSHLIELIKCTRYLPISLTFRYSLTYPSLVYIYFKLYKSLLHLYAPYYDNIPMKR